MNCLHCGEPIIDGDPIVPNAGEPLHNVCFTRMLVGSVGHQRKRCSCFGGTEEDPPNLTKRQAAIAAAYFFEGVHQ